LQSLLPMRVRSCIQRNLSTTHSRETSLPELLREQVDEYASVSRQGMNGWLP
jgi:hypothetical protein